MKFNDTKASRWILGIGLLIATVVYAAPGDMPFDNPNLDGDTFFTVNDGGVTTTALHIDGATSTVSVGPGTAAIPGLRFTNDGDLGLYRSGSNVLGFTAGGVSAGTMSGTNLSLVGDVTTGDDAHIGDSVFASLGAVASPSYSFTGDTNTGMFSEGADEINWATGGALRLSLGGSMVPAVVIRGTDGSNSAPAYSFSGDTNTGIYRDDTGTNSVRIVVDGGGGITVRNGGMTVSSISYQGGAGSSMWTDSATAGTSCDSACGGVVNCAMARIPGDNGLQDCANTGGNRTCLCIQNP